jgi:hypothetical protein
VLGVWVADMPNKQSQRTRPKPGPMRYGEV